MVVGWKVIFDGKELNSMYQASANVFAPVYARCLTHGFPSNAEPGGWMNLGMDYIFMGCGVTKCMIQYPAATVTSNRIF